MNIRQATQQDYKATEALTRNAFWNVYCPGCSEHYLLHLMRRHGDYIPQLDIVAEQDGKLVGHCICFPSHIEGDDGKQHTVLTLGPIAVATDLQRQGIGAALIAKMKEQAAACGYKAIMLCGDPGYYQKRGFTPAKEWNIRNSENKYFRPLQAIEVRKSALTECAGRYIEHEVYFSFTEEDADAFDTHFPTLEKQADTESQKRFRELLEKAEEDF